MIYDFHTHTFLSDGELSPMELIYRAFQNGYRAIAITDHAGPGEIQHFIKQIAKDCFLAEEYWGIRAIPGVELTHLPPAAIPEIAKQAKEMGAQLVVVHGETIVEPVAQGTNMAAARCPHVDILAHPGLLTTDEASFARANGVFVEISARKGHSLTNGHIAKIARTTGADILLGSDAHDEGDLLFESMATAILQGAGLVEGEVEEAL
ncbi:MAG: histidinol phosphate phosphatase domain-containing protein, partial [Chloroflexota bacterium]|nr:histidinol phosphate phosphatase domain-containing protein [Chloroflexota bacterium]